MTKYNDLPTHALIYQHSKAAFPWAVEIERLSIKAPKQTFDFRVYSEGLPKMVTRWYTCRDSDLQSVVSSIVTVIKSMCDANDNITGCSDDYAYIYHQMRKFY